MHADNSQTFTDKFIIIICFNNGSRLAWPTLCPSYNCVQFCMRRVRMRQEVSEVHLMVPLTFCSYIEGQVCIKIKGLFS